MATTSALLPSSEIRKELAARGGESAGRCYQCSTCSSVCTLAPVSAPFPRRQMLWAQWGMVDRLAADPAVWLCHQCNDCNVRCPRDAQPGDVMQTLRALVVRHLSAPAFMGRLVADVRTTWPLLIGLPILFWILLLGATTGLAIPEVHDNPALEGPFHYEAFVPHAHIYVVYTAISLWVVAALFFSGRRFWNLIGAGAERRGSFLGALAATVGEIATHRRFGECADAAAGRRRWGHFLVMWGFVGAAVTSGLLILYLYRHTPAFSWIPLVMPHDYPLPLDHPVKWLGNISAVLLVVGGVILFANRLRNDRKVGDTRAFDRFFLYVVLAVIVTGVLTEALRFLASPMVACGVYLLHLAVVMTLFITVPYSKFAHIVYRTLALVHLRLTTSAQPASARR